MPSDAFICIQWSLFWSQVFSSERSFEWAAGLAILRQSHRSGQDRERSSTACLCSYDLVCKPSAPVCGCGVGVTYISQGPAGYTRAITQGGRG